MCARVLVLRRVPVQRRTPPCSLCPRLAGLTVGLYAIDGVRCEHAQYRPAVGARWTRARFEDGRGAKAEEPEGRFALVGDARPNAREYAYQKQ